MEKVKNIAPGPRGLHSADGPIMLQRGQTVELDIGKENLAAARKTGWFEFDGDVKQSASTSVENLSDEELTAILKDAGVTPDGRWGRDRLISEVKKVQESKG